MQTAVHDEPNYFKIFWWLLALTLVEVGVTYLPMAKFFMVTALILLAFAKAFLVAWYFMHLRSERWILIVMTIIPLLLALDLFIGLLPDLAHIFS